MARAIIHHYALVPGENITACYTQKAIWRDNMVILKLWPMLAFGLLGIIIGAIFTDLFLIEPSKIRILIIAALGLLGTIIGWKFVSKE